MPLELTVDAIETVPEPFRGEYVEKDGKFHLALNGLEKTYVPRDALTRANNEAAQRRHALSAWETAVAGKTVEEVQTLIADFDSGKFNKGKTKEEFDAALAQHKTAAEKKAAELAAERDTAYNVARKHVVDGGLKGALASAKATKTGLAMLSKILGDRIELKFEGGEPVQRILAADGKSPMIGTGADGFATLDDLMKEALRTYPDLFEGSGAGGGGAPNNGGNGGGGAKTISNADFQKLSPKERSAKMADGYILA